MIFSGGDFSEYVSNFALVEMFLGRVYSYGMLPGRRDIVSGSSGIIDIP